MLPKTVLKWLKGGADRHGSIAWIESVRAFRLYLRAGNWESERFVSEVEIDHARAGADIIGWTFERMAQDIDAASAVRTVEPIVADPRPKPWHGRENTFDGA